MKVDDWTSEDVHTSGGGENPPCAGFTSNVLPEAQSNVSAESSQTGVSTKCALVATKKAVAKATTDSKQLKEKSPPQWYALRCTYGREKTAYEYMVAKGVTAFYPTQTIVKLINGKRKIVTESLLPNIFFAYGTFDLIKSFVYDNVNLPFLRFYYCHTHVGSKIKKTPMVIPHRQIESLQIIRGAESDNTIVSLENVPKFEKGQLVRVTEGAFKGVIGRVARWQGQQRVGVVVDDLVTVVTAYIPSAFIESIE